MRPFVAEIVASFTGAVFAVSGAEVCALFRGVWCLGTLKGKAGGSAAGLFLGQVSAAAIVELKGRSAERCLRC